MAPRYDIPKAAPEPLRRVQLLVNSVDHSHEHDWLEGWLAEHGLAGQDDRAREVREALRALALANNAIPFGPDALAVVNAAAARLTFELDEERRLRARAEGDALDEVVAIALNAMLDGTWGRLKACRNCRWCFYDESPNRSATWCSMQICGNRSKTRAYRRRRA